MQNDTTKYHRSWFLTTATLLVALASASAAQGASVGDPAPSLLFSNDATQVVFTIPGVRHGHKGATVVSCSSTQKTGGENIAVGVEFFDLNGQLENDVSSDANVLLNPGYTRVIATAPTGLFGNEVIPQINGLIQSGVARVIADSKKIVCAAFIVDLESTPPSFVTTLPVIRRTSQRGQ